MFYPFILCASQEEPLEISTPRHVYWSAIGTYSSPHFHLKVTAFILCSLHTSTAHCFTFAVTLHFLEPSSASCLVFVSAILRVFLISPRNHPHTFFPDTASSPIVIPCFAASTATIMSLTCTLNKSGYGSTFLRNSLYNINILL